MSEPPPLDAILAALERLARFISPVPWQPFGDSTVLDVKSGPHVYDAKGYSVLVFDGLRVDERARANSSVVAEAPALAQSVIELARTIDAALNEDDWCETHSAVMPRDRFHADRCVVSENSRSGCRMRVKPDPAAALLAVRERHAGLVT